MARFRKITQQTTFTRRDQYDNALTLDRLRGRAKKLSYVEIQLADGEKVNLYFTPIPAIEIINLRDPGADPLAVVHKMIGIVAAHVVDPYTSEPLQSLDAWQQEDEEFLNQVFSAVTGLQFVREGEEVDGETVEVDIDIEAIEALKNDPNPLDATVGSSSPTTSTERSNPDEETSSDG